MNYWIYENWVAEKKAVIHTESCPYCNQGEGIHKDKTDGKNGCWRGPFQDFNAAKAHAKTMHDRTIRCCKVCAPDNGNL